MSFAELMLVQLMWDRFHSMLTRRSKQSGTKHVRSLTWAVGNPMFHMDRMAGWLQRARRMEFSHCCFRMGRPLLPIWISSPSGQNFTKSEQNQPKSPKVNMLKSGDVSFDFGFEWCLGSATGYVAKISMLRLKCGWVLDGPNLDGVRMGRNAG